MKIFTLILTECQARNLESFGNDYLKCLGRWPLQTCRNSKIYAWKCEFLACRPRCGLCRLTITPWGPKVDKLYVANDMAISHNTYIRGINAIYLQAEGVKTVQDKKNFLQYCQFWVESFEHHHDAEEEFFFPSLDKVPGMKGLMDINIEQHKSFHSELEKFDKYVRETKPEDFNGKTLKEIIESFADRVVTHLHGEIETLIGLQKHDPDGEEVKKLYLITEKAIIAKAGLVSEDLPTEI